MVSTKAELLEYFNRLASVKALVVGDIMLDRYIWGSVERISPEAPVPVVLVNHKEDRLGGAGNTVRNLRSLGLSVDLCGFVGDDEEGQRVLTLLQEESIGADGVIVDRKTPTISKTRVIAHHQQVVRIDREEIEPKESHLREMFDEMIYQRIDDTDLVVVSDYGKGAISESLLKMIARASAAGRLSRAKRPVMLDPHPRNYDYYFGMTAVKPNRKEAEQASGLTIRSKQDAIHAAPLILKKWGAEILVLSLAEEGMLVATNDNQPPILLDTVAKKVADVSGAGDAVVAVFSAALAVGAPLRVAGDLANMAAGLVVGEVGTAPVNREAFYAEIQSRKD